MEHHVGRGLAGCFRSLSKGGHAGEEPLCQLTGGAMRLVGHNGHLAAPLPQPLQHFRHAGIRTGLHAGVGLIPRPVIPHDIRKTGGFLSLRQHGGHQLHRAVAQSFAHLLYGPPGIAVLLQCVVDGGGQIRQRIQQRPVHIKEIGRISHGWFLPRLYCAPS